jgi:hypothetical protein
MSKQSEVAILSLPVVGKESLLERQAFYERILRDICRCQHCRVHVTVLGLSGKIQLRCVLCYMKRKALPPRVMTGDGMLSFHPYFDVLHNLGTAESSALPCRMFLPVCRTVTGI